MKMIGASVVSFIAACLHSANAGDPPTLPPHAAEFKPTPVVWGVVHPYQQKVLFVSLESGGPARLELDCWSPGAAVFDFPSDSPTALYLDYGARPNQSAFTPSNMSAQSSRAEPLPGQYVRDFEVNFPTSRKEIRSTLSMALATFQQSGATSSHAKAIPGPYVRAIEVNYPDASEGAKKNILASLRTRVGRRYSERDVVKDIQRLSRIPDLKRIRIFGTTFEDGVRVIVALQPKAGFDFNIGYQF